MKGITGIIIREVCIKASFNIILNSYERYIP